MVLLEKESTTIAFFTALAIQSFSLAHQLTHSHIPLNLTPAAEGEETELPKTIDHGFRLKKNKIFSYETTKKNKESNAEFQRLYSSKLFHAFTNLSGDDDDETGQIMEIEMNKTICDDCKAHLVHFIPSFLPSFHVLLVQGYASDALK